MKSSRGDKIVRRTLADGTVREYRYRRVGAAGAVRARTQPRIAPGSVDALLEAFQRSPEWHALAPKTRTMYRIYFRPLYKLGREPARDVRRGILIGLRNAIATARGTGAATGFMRAASAAFAWAVDNDLIELNPAYRVKGLRGGTLPAWSEPVLRAALAELPEPYRRVVILAVHTGQRRGDLIRMSWADYDGSAIRVRQEKTRVVVLIPAHSELKTELAEWRRSRGAVTILTNTRGQPWTGEHLSRELGKLVRGLGYGRFTLHGLRKLAAARLAEAGCSMREIAAIGGWRSLSMVQHYTRSADQEALARGAIVRLENARKR